MKFCFIMNDMIGIDGCYYLPQRNIAYFDYDFDFFFSPTAINKMKQQNYFFIWISLVAFM